MKCLEKERKILTLAIPIIVGMVSQNLFNLVDIAMVGKLGDVALAAVGISGFASFMFQATVMGVAAGVQAMSSRLKGAEKQNTADPLNSALVIIFCIAPLLSLLICLFMPFIFPMLSSDSKVIAEGIPYIQARVAAMTFVGINLAFRGYWSAINLPQLFMKTLLAMHALNIFLNYLFIFGNFGMPELGVYGAGLASCIATAFGSIVYIWLGWHHARRNGFLQSWPSRQKIFAMCRLSVPSSIEQLFFAGGFTVLFWIIGQVGTSELAAANVLINLMLIVIYPAIGLGITAGALTGQALGRGDVVTAKNSGWDVVKIGVMMLALLGLPMWLFPEWILKLFIQKPETIALASAPLRLIGITIAIIEPLGMIFMYALLGAGDTKRVMLVSTTCMWVIYLPTAYLIGPVLGYGLTEIWVLHMFGYRGLLALCFTILWQRGKWANVKIKNCDFDISNKESVQ